MKWLVVLLILALLLGPVLWLRPSPGDRRRAQIRDRARSLGLHIRVCDLPQARRERVRRDDPQLGAAYSLRTPDGGLSPVFWVKAGNGDWQTADGDPVPVSQRPWLESVVAGLPEGVVALERSDTVAVAYWNERGGAAAVDSVLAGLQRLSAFAADGAGAAES